MVAHVHYAAYQLWLQKNVTLFVLKCRQYWNNTKTQKSNEVVRFIYSVLQFEFCDTECLDKQVQEKSRILSDQIVRMQTMSKDKDKDLFIGLQEFVVGYSKAPEQPQSSARPICHAHTMTRTGHEPATIPIAAYI